eukprot:m.364450 g.364450  ORF g.364450 m.364450 type:complete len:286 (-) comp56037_c0_seq10:85-942(-)
MAAERMAQAEVVDEQLPSTLERAHDVRPSASSPRAPPSALSVEELRLRGIIPQVPSTRGGENRDTVDSPPPEPAVPFAKTFLGEVLFMITYLFELLLVAFLLVALYWRSRHHRNESMQSLLFGLSTTLGLSLLPVASASSSSYQSLFILFETSELSDSSSFSAGPKFRIVALSTILAVEVFGDLSTATHWHTGVLILISTAALALALALLNWLFADTDGAPAEEDDSVTLAPVPAAVPPFLNDALLSPCRSQLTDTSLAFPGSACSKQGTRQTRSDDPTQVILSL